MQAIILAAGMGKRLGKLTENNTKCMLKVNGLTLIERTLDILDEIGIEKLVLVIGYKGENLRNFLGESYKNVKIIYVENKIYDSTNNIYSLYLAKDYLIRADTLLLESDLIFDKRILTRLINHPDKNLAVVSKYESWMDGTVVKLNRDNTIQSFVPKNIFDYNDIDKYYKTVNIYKFSKEFSRTSYVPFLEAYSSALGNQEYYEQVLRIITFLETQDLKALPTENEKWYEIDDVQDLDNAETIFSPEESLLNSMQIRYGGYWRFSNLKDFCYLVNPYFPSEILLSEIKCYFNDLIAQYPSGLDTQNLLVSKLFNCDREQILVGNGAAELINAYCSNITGKVGIIHPTFNEYPERLKEDQIVKFFPENKNFSYTIDDLKAFSNEVDIILLINPDNPSGHFIPMDKLFNLLDFLKKGKKTLILDESFVDFAAGGYTNSMISEENLVNYTNLVIIKSISKSYGVPGIRLGVLASGDKKIITEVRRKLSIWNINSFGEFFLQIIGKYAGTYQTACEKIANERDLFLRQLQKIKFLRVIPSQANYFLCEVIWKYSATELAEKLLKEHEILIKDLSDKAGFESGEYIRIAVRNREDNEYLIERLRAIDNTLA